ncbi:hypothetical protein HPT27_03695 [Permianibacter sp. IMCC34836]|uniref:Nif11 family protein n=1 Tax=Permianibacter fluminis TaxID=2738515 RepID=UPI0015567189|nr:Nif11 family protein [Permianibacter fluminis]NQD36114.1 hypothetical protein [Permianibacter fluminis]
MSAENLKKFLMNMAQDPKLRARYLASPKKTMTEQGVSKNHQNMILSGDSHGITRELGGKDTVCITHINGYKK